MSVGSTRRRGDIEDHEEHEVRVENKLIVQLKSVDEIRRIHEAQLLTYMKLAEVKIGLLMNFNVTALKDGIKRFVL